jgi:hypothetical protein
MHARRDDGIGMTNQIWQCLNRGLIACSINIQYSAVSIPGGTDPGENDRRCEPEGLTSLRGLTLVMLLIAQQPKYEITLAEYLDANLWHRQLGALREIRPVGPRESFYHDSSA